MEGGGSQRSAILLAREFRRLGHDVETWFLFRRRGVYDSEPMTKCLFPEDPKSPLDYIKIFSRLYSRLHQHRPDCILTFTHYANVFGCMFALLAGVKIRLARQTGLPQRNPMFAKILDFIFGTIGVYTANFANSKTTFEAFARYPSAYRRRMKTVFNGVEIVKSSGNREKVKDRLGLAEGGYVILAVGRLHAPKNYALLMKAVARIPDVNLIIAGGGAERENLDRLITRLQLENRVRLLGDLPPNELGDLYLIADCFVHPSLWESFGVAVVEAAGAGLPLALSDIPAMREIAGEDALYFNPMDVDEIEEAVRKLIFDDSLRRGLADKGPALVEPFTVQAMAKGFLSTIAGTP
jgi:glycosyltransferase involved in cell wall biosynthesis